MTATQSGQGAKSAIEGRRFRALDPVGVRLCRCLGAALLLIVVFPMSDAAADVTVCSVDIAAAQARLAGALIGRLAKSAKPGNIVVAPASLSGAFGTLYLGADPAMGKALSSSLGFAPEAGGCGPGDQFFALGTAAADLAKGAADTVRTADRLVLDPATRPYPLLLEGLAARGREIVTDDLSRPEGLARVNDWVKKETQGLIPAILPGPLERPALTVLDALYFKASWATRFDPALTKPHPFQGADGKGEEVLLMHLADGKYLFRRNDEFVAADLPFAGERLSLVLVTTTAKPAPAAAFARAMPFLDGTGYAPLSGTIALPRLKLSAAGNLLSALPEVEKAGRGSNALGGFAPNVRVSQVLQRVEMSADENGAEAAAATAVTTTRSFEGRPIAFVLDRPFLFALRDRATGLILVAGYVADPGRAVEATKADAGGPEAVKPAVAKPDGSRPDAATVGVGAPDGAKSPGRKPKVGRVDAGEAGRGEPGIAKGLGTSEPGNAGAASDRSGDPAAVAARAPAEGR